MHICILYITLLLLIDLSFAFNRLGFSHSHIKSSFQKSKSHSRLQDLSFSFDFLNNGAFHIEPIINGASKIVEVIHDNVLKSSLFTGSAETIIPPSSLDPLGNDLLIFLCATIGIVPFFKWLNASPVLGFLSAGLIMGPAGLGLFEDLSDMEALAEFGVLFLLFEQGLELTVERLQSLSKYAFGMGTAQVLLCTMAFFAFPFLGGVQILEYIFGSEASVVDITRIDEALVIGAALSLSSSAFVLKILQEKGQLSSKFGSAALGILLMQDIAVVPLLVLLPIIESNSGGAMSIADQATLLGATILKAVFGLGGILFAGGAVVRFLFSIVAKSQSSETFVALCLLVAVGIGALTDSLGLSSTLGAFVAGTLLAESNYRTQIETDIKPFKGLLLGLFFLTTGASVDPYVIQEQWPTVLALLGGLLAFKTVIITALGPFFDLSKAESVRTGLLLSGGGEFAFVVLTLADKLNVLPNQLAKILVGVVVLSMALTPYLSILGDKLSVVIQDYENKEVYKNAVLNGEVSNNGEGNYNNLDTNIPNNNNNNNNAIKDNISSNNNSHGEGSSSDMIVVCGYGTVGETIVRFLTSLKLEEKLGKKINYMAFDLDPSLVVNGYKNGYRTLYGDGSQPLVLETAGVKSPKAFIVTYSDSESSFKAVERLRQAFPNTPIIARALGTKEYYHLLDAGATLVVSDEREASFRLAGNLLFDLGLDTSDINILKRDIADYLDQLEGLTHLKQQNKKTNASSSMPSRVAMPSMDQLFYDNLATGADKNLYLKKESKNPMIVKAKKNLELLINSVVSLGEEYIWVSDDELKKALTTIDISNKQKVLYYEEEKILNDYSDNNNNNVIIDYVNTNNLSNNDILETEKEFDENLAKLGVTLCVLPPKNKTTSTNSNSDESSVAK